MANPHPRALAGIEGRLPPEIAEKAEGDGVAKAGQDAITLLSLGVLGGGFITFGAIFATVALTGAEGVLPFGIARVVAGLVFALGLSLVLIGGAQIFTGDVLMVMAWASGRLKAVRVARVWALVWIGNLLGSSALPCLCCLLAITCSAQGRSALRRCAPPKQRLRCPSAARSFWACSVTLWSVLPSGCRSPAGSHPPRDTYRVADSRFRCRGI